MFYLKIINIKYVQLEGTAMKDVEFTNFKLNNIDKEIIEKDKIKYKKKIN